MKEPVLTKEELRQIFYINKEIVMWQKELERLRCTSMVKSQIISDMPRGGCHRGLEDYVVDLVEYETIIKGLLAKVQAQRKKIVEFIDGIDDSLMKQIVFYRHISCMTWNEVANMIGGGNTEDSIRVAYNRYFKK